MQKKLWTSCLAVSASVSVLMFYSAFAASTDEASGIVYGASQGGNQAVRLATSAAKSEVQTLWPNAPAWVSRTEWDIGWNDEESAEFRVLTTQPLYRSDDRVSTFFTQASYLNYDLYDIRRQTANLGLGYRHLLMDNALLLGANLFGDYEFNYDHKRWSVGMEAKYGPADLALNRYIGLGGAHTVKGASERVMDGYDAELGMPLPYLPWAGLFGRYFVWEKEVGRNDTTGNEFSAELNLHPNVALIGGTRNDNRNDRENYVMVRFRLGDDGRPTLATTPSTGIMWTSRDLRDETLKKVRRENRIITERTTSSSGVTVVVRRG